jgi:drug/metabolite transporter (DMT)-like permease
MPSDGSLPLEFRYPGILTATQSTPEQRRNALIAVACATVIQTVAQLLIKQGTALLGPNPTLTEAALGMFTVLPLFGGYALYGLFTIIMVFALKHGELSMLYPMMALSFVWVTVVSALWLHEPVNFLEIAGVAAIISGVGLLGRGEAK